MSFCWTVVLILGLPEHFEDVPELCRYQERAVQDEEKWDEQGAHAEFILVI